MLRLFPMLKNLSSLCSERLVAWSWKMESGVLQQKTSASRLPRLPLGYRITASALSALLFITSSPPLLAISMGQIRAGSATPGAGGQGSAPNLQNAGAASAALTAAMAQGNLKKANEIIVAMRKVQADARKILPDASSVPNGLRPGGLEVYNPSGSVTASGVPTSWTPQCGISSLSQSPDTPNANASVTVNITQSQQNAYLYWNKFNVGPKTTVNFDQSAGGRNAGQWIAFNKVMSASAPSHIFGNINAQGQVYILNQNGILFHNGSAVNTHSLVASTLPINQNLAGDRLNGVTGAGIVNFPASSSGKTPAQFLFTALDKDSYDPSGNSARVTSVGDVSVEKGAIINASQDASGSGGLVALIGANVANNGSISTPSGQSILAAGLQVALTPHPSTEPSLRGLDVNIGAVTDRTGQVTPLSGSSGLALNDVSGIVTATQGGITMAGGRVMQNGVIDLSTSVSFNGRVDLLANYGATINPNYQSGGVGSPFFYSSTGAVEIGAGGVVRILPEWDSSSTINGTSLALSSLVHVFGHDITVAQGGMILAPGATATAGALDMTGSILGTGVTIQAGEWTAGQLGYTGGTVSLSEGSIIDVSGSTGVTVDGSQNFLGLDPKNPLQLRGAELANSPLQRTSVVRGKNIVVDIRNSGTFNGQNWVGTPLGEVSGYAALIQKGVGQLTVNGGSVGISAGNAVDISQGASVNVSGGWVMYQGGYRSTSMLTTADGRIVGIAQATPDQIYTSVVQGPSRYDPSYFSGGAGGGLSITAPVIVPNGELHGRTVSGAYQLRAFGNSSKPAPPPAGSSLTLNFYGQSGAALAISSAAAQPTVTLGSEGVSVSTSIFLPESILSDEGFGNLSINNHDGIIVVPRNSTISAPLLASINLTAARLDVEGEISAPSGSINLTADLMPYDLKYGISLVPYPNESILNVLTDVSGHHFAQYGSDHILDSSGNVMPMPSGLSPLNAGVLTLGPSGVLSVAGTLSSDFLISPQPWQPSSIKGGSVAVNSYSMELKSGSVVDVSGGVLVTAKGSPSYGAGGSISLAGGQDPEMFRPTMRFGSVSLGATLLGYGGWGMAGGSLAISAPAIDIGGIVNQGHTWLPSSFFDGLATPGSLDQAGFSGFTFQGFGAGDGTGAIVPGIHVAAGVLRPVVLSRMASGTDGTLRTVAMPRNMAYPASISLKARSLTDATLPVPLLLVRGDAVIDAGATITLAPGLYSSSGNYLGRAGSFSVTGDTVGIEGSIIVPGGTITVKGGNSLPSNDKSVSLPSITVDLAPGSLLNASGTFLASDALTSWFRPASAVLAGGSISVSGNILAEAASSLEARGASGMVNLPGDAGPISVRMDTSGGQITLSGGQMMSVDSSLDASSGGSSAQGGSLTLASGRFYSPGDALRISDQANPSLVITGLDSHGNEILSAAKPSTFTFSGSGAIGRLVSWGDEMINGGGRILSSTVSSGDFSSVNLQGNLSVRGAVGITADSSIVLAASRFDALGEETGGILGMSSLGGVSSLNLTAPYVRIGRDFKTPVAPGDFALTAIYGNGANPLYVAPSGGPGVLTIQSSVVDLGNLSLQGLSTVAVTASSALRGDGTVDIAGDLSVSSPVIYPSSGTQFTIVAYNRYSRSDRYHSSGDATDSLADNDSILPGSVTLERSGVPSVPFSVAGTLSIYASSISQGGALIAPFGRINLGWDTSANQPGDPLTGAGAFNARSPLILGLPALNQLTLTGGTKPDHSDRGITSVSGVDPVDPTRSVTVPFGTSSDGLNWISPSGADISSKGGLLAADGTSLSKGVNIKSGIMISEAGSLIDLGGGGDFYSLHWVSGLQGTVDLLGVVPDTTAKISTSYAIVPDYTLPVSPFGYAQEPSVGSTFHLSDMALGLDAGQYVLLPAVFATLPGAYLLSSLPSSLGAATASISQRDGSSVVRGYIADGMNASLGATLVSYSYQLRTSSQVAQSAQYDRSLASGFFAKTDSDPGNGSSLSLRVADSASLRGAVNGSASRGSVKSLIDIDYAKGITISRNGLAGGSRDLKLSAATISSWDFGSLLIGGSRSQSFAGATATTVDATSVTLDDGVLLSGSEIMLAAKNLVQIGAGAKLISLGSEISPDPLITLSGEGALVRVSGDQNASVVRSHFQNDGSKDVLFGLSGGDLVIQDGSTVTGLSMVLDSTGTGNIIAPTASLNSARVNIAARAIGLNLASDTGSLPSGGIFIGKTLLSTLGSIRDLSLSSYSVISLNGGGSFGDGMIDLQLHAGEIQLGDGNVVLNTGSLLVDNARGATSGSPAVGVRSLEIDSGSILLGDGQFAFGGMSSIVMNASRGLTSLGRGSIEAGGSISMSLPAVIVASGSDYSIASLGAFTLTASGSTILPASGIGGILRMSGATLDLGAPIQAPGGVVSLTASENLSISSTVTVSGSSALIGTVSKDYDAGTITLNSQTGDILLKPGSLLDVSTDSSGNAGSITVSAPDGSLRITSVSFPMNGESRTGQPGSFSLDVSFINRGSNPGDPSDLTSLENSLKTSKLISAQVIRIRSGDVLIGPSAMVRSYDYSLETDGGSVKIAGEIDASEKMITDSGGYPIFTGGSISIQASGSVILEAGSLLSVHGDHYDNAGKGGSIFLSAGAEINGVINSSAKLDLKGSMDGKAASKIDLGVTATPTSIQDLIQDLGGVLHLRAPITQAPNYIQIGSLDSTITGASSIEVEGYQLYKLSGTSDISAVRDSAYDNAKAFFGDGSDPTMADNSLTAKAILERLTANQNSSVKNILNLAPGVEIINRDGDLTLAKLSDWDFSSWRFGANSTPGFMTLRASGNITLKSSLSDGFQAVDSMGNALPSGADFRAVLMPLNPLVPRNFQSWDYRITAGANLGAANLLAVNESSFHDINLGVTAQDGIPTKSGVSVSGDGQGENATTLTAITDGVLMFGQDPTYYAFQTIRTGTGDIRLSTSGNFQMWNQFSTVYTAGALATGQDLGGGFDLPTAPSHFIDAMNRSGQTSYLGVAQQDWDGFNPSPYAPQYAAWGGDLSIQAGKDMQQLTYNRTGTIIKDAVSEMPSNWLYRRGAVGPDGSFLKSGSEVLSTTWWVDYSNFFDGVATLGGGNLTLCAGGSIRDINASLPTNFRMAGHASGSSAPLNSVASARVELGGGDLRVITGGDLDAGVYYVERGVGDLKVGGSVNTDKTRSINRPEVTGTAPSWDQGYLPSTFFMGKGGINLAAAGNITLGPIANVFMTPQGINNGYWYRTYFSTYAQTDWVKVSSTGGNITFRNSASTPGGVETTPLLIQWFNSFTAPATIYNNISSYQPWARFAVTSVSPADFAHALTLAPPTLGAVSFGGDITLQGGFDLSPSPSGNFSLVAAGSVSGLALAGGQWISSTVNMSDASPSSLPSVNQPVSQASVIGTAARDLSFIQELDSTLALQNGINAALGESGSYSGSASLLAYKLALHDQLVLHKTDPLQTVISTARGDVVGLTLYSPVASRITAGGAITDNSFYIQNVNPKDITVITSGGEMSLYNPLAKQILDAQRSLPAQRVPILSGDLQISGPGTMEVLAGSNLDLGRNPNSGDPSLNNGITSIGNARNPALSAQGANIFIAAGLPLNDEFSAQANLNSFTQWALGGFNASRYLNELGQLQGYSGGTVLPLAKDLFLQDSDLLTPEQRSLLKMNLFYLVLRDSARDRSDPDSPAYGTYAAGEKAIEIMTQGVSLTGSISTWSQSITTVNGGNIDLFVPGGGIDMGAIAYKGASKVAPGIITQGGGNVNIYVRDSLSIGINRIFTLKGGNIMIWSEKGNIAAGASSKTVQSAPPTQVLIDPQSANVEVNLAGLATGGGIGVLATLAGVEPGDVDLIAVSGVIDAGDAGIRSSGNLRLSATKILNADNIAAAGIVVGAPAAAPASAPAPAAPPAAAPPAAASTAAAANNSAAETASKNNAASQGDDTPSIYSIDILGYGGGDEDDQKQAADATVAPVQASL